jgi:hypothetical protein
LLGLDDRLSIPDGNRDFFSSHYVKTGSGSSPESYPLGTRESFYGVKQQERDPDHSPPSNAEVKDAWSFTFTSSRFFALWFLIKDNFTSKLLAVMRQVAYYIDVF